jgi:hypothetical protein
MTSQFYNKLSSGIYLDSYESEMSNDGLYHRKEFIQNLVNNLVNKIKKVFKLKRNDVWNKIKISVENYNDNDEDEINPNILIYDNIRYEINSFGNNALSDNYNYVSDGDGSRSENDIEARLRIIKFNILHAKLLTLFGIVKKYIKTNFISMIERLRLKTQMENVFSKDDNYLYMLPRPKLFKFKNHYAYRRLLYVIKSYKFRINFLMKNCFTIWRDMIVINEIKNNSDKKEITLYDKVNQLTSIIEKNLTQKTFNHTIYKILFHNWHGLSDKNNTREFSKDNLQRILLGYDKIEFILKKYKKLSFIYLLSYSNHILHQENIFSECYSNLNKDISSLKELFKNNNENIDVVDSAFQSSFELYERQIYNQQNYKKLQNILVGLFYIYSKNFVNKSLFHKFYKWKSILVNENNNSLNELKTKATKLTTEGILTGFNIIKGLYHIKYKSNIYFQMRIFLLKLKGIIKLRNTLKEYGKKYTKILNLLSEDRRINIMLMREVFKKIFTVKKLFMLILKKQYSFHSNSNAVNLQKKNISFQNFLLIGCFYRWKASIIDGIRYSNFRKLKVSNILTVIENKICKNNKRDFMLKFKLMPKIKYEQSLLIKTFSRSLLNLLSRKFFKLKFNTFTNVFLGNKLEEYTLKELAMKLIILYKNQFNKDLRGAIGKAFDKWKLNSKLKYSLSDISTLPPNLIKKVLYFKYIFIGKYSRDIRPYFLKFKIKTTSKVVIVRQPNRIDNLIVKNMNGILLEYENDDNKLTREILAHKFSMASGSVLLKILSKLHYEKAQLTFKKWVDIVFPQPVVPSEEQLIDQLELLKVEDEELVANYRNKKVTYKKTIEDYEFIKSHFCENCLGEDLEIDYKSVNNENTIIDEENKRHEEVADAIRNTGPIEEGDLYYKTHTTSFDDSKYIC